MPSKSYAHLLTGLDFPWKIHNPYFIAAIAVLGGAMFGFDIASMSSFIQQDSYVNFFGSFDPVIGRKALTPIRQAGITSSMPGGSFLACLVSGKVCDAIGRRNIIQLSAVIWMIGAAIQCSSQNIVQLIFGRLIAGWAIGFASSQTPVYISEMAPKRIRGRLGSCFQWAITWGIMIMFFIGYGCGNIDGGNSVKAWRAAWGIQMVPGFFLLIGCGFLPESPRWLAQKGHWDEAIRLISLIQAKGDTENEEVKIEIEEIKEVVLLEQNSKFTIFDMFKGRVNQRRTLVGLWCQIWQQMTGMNVLMYYVVDVFDMAGVNWGSKSTNLIAGAIQYVINVAMTVPALLFVDRWGRRRMMYYGSFIMMIWLWAIAGTFAVNSVPTGPNGWNGNSQIRIHIPESNKAASKGLIAMSYLFVATFAPTWGPAGWLYCSEIWPMEQRATGSALAAAANWIFNFCIGMFTPSAFANITWKTYCIFAVFCFCMTIHVFLLFPETHGHTLEEINQLWEENIPAWKTTNWKPKYVPNVRDMALVESSGQAPELVPKQSLTHGEDVAANPEAKSTASGTGTGSISSISAHAEKPENTH